VQVGNAHLGTAPYDCYRASDGWVVIAVASNKLFRALAGAIGRPELGSDARFKHVAARVQRREEVNGIIGAWVGERTVAEVVCALGPAGAGVPCSPVYTVDQLLAHPQLVARGMIQRLPHPVLGEMVVPGVVPKLSETPGEIRTLGPGLGQHNDEIYGTLLGLSPDEIVRLRELKAI